MINEDICKLRDELNKKIEQGADYEEIYKISTDLDELIAKYYEEKKENDSFKAFEHRRERSAVKEKSVAQLFAVYLAVFPDDEHRHILREGKPYLV